MKRNKLTIMILVAVMLVTITCAISLPDLYTAWAEAEELATLRADIDSLKTEVNKLNTDINKLKLEYDSHTHNIETDADLQDQFDKLAKDLSDQVETALELLENR